MNKYKLIKLEQGYIIISDEKLTLNDTLNTCYYLFDNKIFKREYSHHKEGKKIIASTFIPELPSVDFNGFEEKFGIVDVEQLALQYAEENGNVYNQEFEYFEAGFNKCLELKKIESILN